MNRRPGKRFSDGIGPLHPPGFDQSGEHGRRDALADSAQMPAVVDVNGHAAAYLPLAMSRCGDDVPIDGDRRSQADEIPLLPLLDDQRRQPVACRSAAARSARIAGIKHPAGKEEHDPVDHEGHDRDDEPTPEHARTGDACAATRRQVSARRIVFAQAGQQREQFMAPRLELHTNGALVEGVDEGIHGPQKPERETAQTECSQPTFRLFQANLDKERRECNGARQQIPPEHMAQQPDLMFDLSQ
jgi:hypothetical protein